MKKECFVTSANRRQSSDSICVVDALREGAFSLSFSGGEGGGEEGLSQ